MGVGAISRRSKTLQNLAAALGWRVSPRISKQGHAVVTNVREAEHFHAVQCGEAGDAIEVPLFLEVLRIVHEYDLVDRLIAEGAQVVKIGEVAQPACSLLDCLAVLQVQADDGVQKHIAKPGACSP